MKPDDILEKGFDDIASMADRLGLVTIIKNSAYEIYKNVGGGQILQEKKAGFHLYCLPAHCLQRKKAATPHPPPHN